MLPRYQKQCRDYVHNQEEDDMKQKVEAIAANNATGLLEVTSHEVTEQEENQSMEKSLTMRNSRSNTPHQWQIEPFVKEGKSLEKRIKSQHERWAFDAKFYAEMYEMGRKLKKGKKKRKELTFFASRIKLGKQGVEAVISFDLQGTVDYLRSK
ncbi:hypothetical protein Tco_1148653, partial [Tanacetum coccineum]